MSFSTDSLYISFLLFCGLSHLSQRLLGSRHLCSSKQSGHLLSDHPLEASVRTELRGLRLPNLSCIHPLLCLPPVHLQRLLCSRNNPLMCVLLAFHHCPHSSPSYRFKKTICDFFFLLEDPLWFSSAHSRKHTFDSGCQTPNYQILGVPFKVHWPNHLP